MARKVSEAVIEHGESISIRLDRDIREMVSLICATLKDDTGRRYNARTLLSPILRKHLGPLHLKAISLVTAKAGQNGQNGQAG